MPGPASGANLKKTMARKVLVNTLRIRRCLQEVLVWEYLDGARCCLSTAEKESIISSLAAGKQELGGSFLGLLDSISPNQAARRTSWGPHCLCRHYRYQSP